MQLEEITPELLRDTLKAFVTTQSPPDALMGLHCLKHSGPKSERVFVLQDYLYDTVLKQLTALRHAEDLPDDRDLPQSREAVSMALARDFSRNNPILAAWSALYHRYVSLLASAMNLDDLAAAANVTSRHFRRRVAEGLGLLVNELKRAEMEAHRSIRRLHIRRYFPVADYGRLFGVDELAARVVSILSEATGAPLVSLDGIGGIGKTTLALAVADRMADKDIFAGILWVSARQTQLMPTGEIRTISQPVLTFDALLSRLAVQVGREDLLGFDEFYKEQALREAFHDIPYLVIVDNLETMDDYRALAPRLRPMADGTRFLLTTRYSMSEYSFVRSIHVPPLSEKDGISLLRYELERYASRDHLPSNTALKEIYHLVGGLPLALKLVAGQLRHLPTNVVMDNLRSAGNRAAASLYTYIYRRTWALLDEPARHLLLDMLTISPDGEDLEWLRLVSDLTDEQLEQAIAQLTDLALLQTTGTFDHTFYRLHRLTVTFLQTEILAVWEK